MQPHHWDGHLEGLLEWLFTHRARLKSLVREHGAIIFRDFAVRSVADFKRVLFAIDDDVLPYLGGAKARHDIGSDEKLVYFPTSAPPYVKNHLHCEMAYQPI